MRNKKNESSEKGKTESARQQDLEKVEIIERKQQQVEKTTVQKDYHNISENIINNGMENKMTCNKITYNMSLNKQESSSQVKQQISGKLIQENDYYNNIKKQMHLKTEQSQEIKTPDIDTEIKSKEVENQTKKRLQNVGEIIEDKVPVEVTNIQTQAKKQENDLAANKASNNQPKKRNNR